MTKHKTAVLAITAALAAGLMAITPVEAADIKMEDAVVGDTITFGTYEQDGDTTNGKEPVTWRVLAREEDRLLLISEYGLDARSYHMEYTDVTWQTCSLRQWLNEDFYQVAFTPEEQSQIDTVSVEAQGNDEYGTDPGGDTEDKVFMLSFREAEQYFADDAARSCRPTVYALEQGAWTKSSDETGGEAACWWWLRSPGDTASGAGRVTYRGLVSRRGGVVSSAVGSVRPALWLRIGDEE